MTMTAGKGCTVYDVAICNSVYDLIKVVVLSSQATDTSQERAGMQEFIIELIFCQIEHRANLLLNRGTMVLNWAAILTNASRIQNIAETQVHGHASRASLPYP